MIKIKQLYIIDTTLRDGEQTVGVAFSAEEKKKIAIKLDEMGCDIIEAGIPAMGTSEIKAINGILELGLKAEILTWNRMNKKDFDKSLETGCRNVYITVPASNIHIYKVKYEKRASIGQNERSCVI